MLGPTGKDPQAANTASKLPRSQADWTAMGCPTHNPQDSKKLLPEPKVLPSEAQCSHSNNCNAMHGGTRGTQILGAFTAMVDRCTPLEQVSKSSHLLYCILLTAQLQPDEVLHSHILQEETRRSSSLEIKGDVYAKLSLQCREMQIRGLQEKGSRVPQKSWGIDGQETVQTNKHVQL